MRIGVIFLMFVSTLAFSQETKSKKRRSRRYKNMLEFSRNGIDVSLRSESVEYRGVSTTSDIDISTTDFKLNYARKIASNLWVQGILTYEQIDYDYPATNFASRNDSTDTITTFQVNAIYDLSKNPLSSFFALGGFRFNSVKSESQLLPDQDIQLTGFSLGFGKRFSLRSIGIPNASYTVSARYFIDTGDNRVASISFDDIDADSTGFKLHLVEIDLFF